MAISFDFLFILPVVNNNLFFYAKIALYPPLSAITRWLFLVFPALPQGRTGGVEGRTVSPSQRSKMARCSQFLSRLAAIQPAFRWAAGFLAVCSTNPLITMLMTISSTITASTAHWHDHIDIIIFTGKNRTLLRTSW